MRSDLQFLHFAHYLHCTARVDKHFEGYYSLQMMSQGQVQLSYDQTHYTLDGAWYWPAMPGPHIRFCASPSAGWWEHRYVAFTGRLADRWVADGLWLAGPLQCLSPPAGIAAFDMLLRTLRLSNRWSHYLAINQLERILLDLAQQPSAPAPARWLGSVLATLSDRLDTSIDYHRLAQSAGLGFSTFRRQFKTLTGRTPHAYRIAARINSAKQLLGQSDLAIKEIAHRLGYGDVFHFSRQFRQVTGLPPSAFRSSAQR